MARQWFQIGLSAFIIVTLILLIGPSAGQQENEINSMKRQQQGPSAGADHLLSGAFWRNAKPGDFERLFVPSGMKFDQLSAAAQKKAWYRMFKKAISARGSARYLLKKGNPMARVK